MSFLKKVTGRQEPEAVEEQEQQEQQEQEQSETTKKKFDPKGPVTLNNTALISKFEVEGFTFFLGPEGFNDLASAWATTGDMGLGGDSGNVVMTQLRVMNRIMKWDGPILNPDGTLAPCTRENKNSFFGQRPDLLLLLSEQVYEAKHDELKNSSTSRVG